MNFFKGYVPTKNKKSLMPFKNVSPDELQTYEQVKNMPEFAGVLDEDVIVIDIDDFDLSEKLMQIVEDKEIVCRVYATTRGKHFVFKNVTAAGETIQSTCKTHTQLACGLTADIKVGCRNSLEVLKFNGKEREIIYDKLEDEEYQPLPKWLVPVRNSMDFLKMSEGDGRNQSLFNYILTLQSSDFSVDECRECIKIINDYVLEEPLDDEEIDTILRDDSFKKPVFLGKKVLFFLINLQRTLRTTTTSLRLTDRCTFIITVFMSMELSSLNPR